MALTPLIPAIFFCFAAMVLLLFVSIGVPTWSHVSFLTVGRGHELKYGIFGSTPGTGPSVGYYFTNSHMNSTILHNLTKTLILHALAAGMAGFAFFSGLLAAIFRFRVCAIIMTLLAGFGMMTTFVAWVIDMILFGIARQRYRNDGDVAQYGNANWLTLGALVALTLGFCTSTCSIFGRYRRKRDVSY